MIFTATNDTVIDNATAWWESTLEWVEGAGTLVTCVVILLGAFVLWLAGRLAIRGIVRAIRDGMDWPERQVRDVLTKVNLAAAEQASAADQLADERRRKRADTIGMVLRAALNVVVVAITVLMILSTVGVSITPILASAGVVGVALGFGAQSLVKDILTGVFMLVEDQFGVGDIIDVGEASGSVEEIGLRTTRLRSLDGTLWFVPNGEIRRVGNMTQLWSRVLIEVRFAYDEDVDAAREAMLDAAARAAEDPSVAAAIVGEPEVAGIESLEYNAVKLRLLVQVRPVTQWMAMRAIRRHMRDIFVERGIRLAAPADALIQGASDVVPAAGSRKAAPRATPATKSRATAPKKK